jgi:ERCC4-related helicase
MALIDNKLIYMKEAISNALQTSDRLDILTGYFYLSGFNQIYKQSIDKKIRLLIGIELDISLIGEITKALREDEYTDLTEFISRKKTESKQVLEDNFIKTLIAFINDTDLFDKREDIESLRIFLEKIENGTIEIKKTIKNHHAKIYLIHNKPELSNNGDAPGTVIMGSSNFSSSGFELQGELNKSSRNKEDFDELGKKFEELWDDSNSVRIVDNLNSKIFIKNIKEKIWTYKVPKPSDIYNRILHELFKEKEDKIITPYKITKGKYSNLLYQVDAVKNGIDKLNKYDGVIIADVVGLGKSIIASTIARNLDDYEPLIICPPHLIDQWEDYRSEFGLKGSVFSSGNIKKLYEKKGISDKKQLIIVDEAHRFRNDETNDYKLLHQITRNHPDNKVLLLTATPFSNQPSDIFSLIKLFQVPGYSTLRTVSNLSAKFKDLIKRYKKIRKSIAESNYTEVEQKEAKSIALEQRRLIENIVIRRSRIDLTIIEKYRDDLDKQNIKFPKVIGPEVVEYNLGDYQKDYIDTLNKLSDEESGFKGTRYNPANYQINQQKFENLYGKKSYETELRVSQIDLGMTIKRLLIMRFESSLSAFLNTLVKMIEKYNQVVEYYFKTGEILISFDEYENFEEDSVDFLTENKLRSINSDVLVNKFEFEKDLVNDQKILKEIFGKWNNKKIDDEKLKTLSKILKNELKNNPDKKIVVFSNYADTVSYIYSSLKSIFNNKIISYTSKSPKSLKNIIINDFDASVRQDLQTNEFDVLICTDTLSEGLNLNRAGIVINYDIPYNPTKVIQRVGRINRINKKMFDTINILNFFPTATGESIVKIKLISTLKILFYNSIIGSDTKHLTENEDLNTFFKKTYDEVEKTDNSESWDTQHINNYEKFKHNLSYIDFLNKLPRRTRVRRNKNSKFDSIAFAKRNDDVVFITNKDNLFDHLNIEESLKEIYSKDEEVGYEVTEALNESVTNYLEKIIIKNEVSEITGKRSESLKNLKYIRKIDKSDTNYLDDLIKVIQEYEDLTDGVFKEILNIDINSNDYIIKLKEIIPPILIKNIILKAERAKTSQELLMFIEEFKNDI